VRIAALTLLLAGAAACGGKKEAAVPGAEPATAGPQPIIDVSKSLPREPCPDVPANQLPPAGSKPLVRCVIFQFHPVDQPLIDPDTYGYYIKTRGSTLPEAAEPATPTTPAKPAVPARWVPYDEDQLQSDWTALWKTNFLDNLWIQVVDQPYANGVDGKEVVFHFEERPKLKGVEYTGSKIVDTSKIEDELKKKGLELRIDSFIDESTVQRVKGVIKQMYADEGYLDATVTPNESSVQGVAKLVILTYHIDQGPQLKIKEVVFDGAKAFTSKKLASQMKDNTAGSFWSFITGSGKYQEGKLGDDVQKVVDFYWQQGYMQARIGLQQIDAIGDSKDGKQRYIRLRLPVDEGDRYRFGKLKITGNSAVRTAYIQSVFKMKEGDWADWKQVTKGMEKLQETYGAGGYFHFGAKPEPEFPGRDPGTNKVIDAATYKPVMDLNLDLVEGKQFLVNRITFLGNTTTHDTVVRRELRLVEGGIFNVEALKNSVRRLNQLGYFKPLESDDAVKIDETPGTEGKVDVTLKFQEQNRNQITFGAGVSQLDGFFGQLGFSTSNFLGRGESLGVQLQKGSQAKNYEVSFTEPFLFDRPISAGASVFSRSFIYPTQYTIESTGGTVTGGLPVTPFTRLFLGYSYEVDTVPQSQINPIYLTKQALESDPFLADELLINEGGKRTVGKVSPSLVYDTVNSPLFPDQGQRYVTAFDFAGVGGNTQFVQTRLEGTWYHRLFPRQSFGIHVQGQYIRPYGDTTIVPIFDRLFLGGEYSIRGFDLRTIGPRDPATGAEVGGNKTLLFNGEYTINVGGPVRLVFFYDAGEVRDTGQSFGLYEPTTQFVLPPVPLLTDPFNPGLLTNPNDPSAQPHLEVTGRTSAIKSSTGMEVRFFMPVLNIPFRLIFAYNPSRVGVLNQNLVLTKSFVIKFAVGTTF
jgi:outer membrane protein insertion porin family